MNGFARAQPGEEYKGTGYCAGCHSSEVGEWAESTHINAYSNEKFQADMKELGNPQECLECHTTGYEQDTNTYSEASVTCEACHGPGDTMNKDTSPELCGECHSGPYPTYEEWSSSGPSHGSADCITCHDNHTSKLNYGTTTETCGQCHESHVIEVSETKHGINNINCENCHMIREEADFINEVQGKTGHSFNPIEEELDCTSCHDRPLDKHDVLGEKSGACLSCHGDIHELRLELVNGKTYENDDPVPLCAQCHNERYTAWEQGTHGAHDNPQAVCTECHDPHEPIINGISILDPIPNRNQAEPLSATIKLGFVATILILGLSVIILRRQAVDV